MAKLKHHDESDVACLARVKQCTQKWYADFADHKTFVEYFNEIGGHRRASFIQYIAWLHEQYQLFLMSVGAFVAE